MIDIVLATFNGERFISDQIQSIQANHDYLTKIARLIIVDDGSTDNTQKIVESLAAQDNKIEWISNNSLLHGPSNNFSFGLSHTTAEYIMLSDQDDIWLPNKISYSLTAIQALEKPLLKEPLLVFTDKLIVDESLTLICDSYYKLKNIPFDWYKKFEQLCQQNVASGCTMLFNRELLTKALPVPKNAYMHDWWLILVASRCGKIELIEEPLIQYRQHNGNSIGAKKINKWQLFSAFSKHLTNFEKSFLLTIEQAKAFKKFERKQKLSEDKTIDALSKLKQLPRQERVKLFMNNTITRSHIFGKIALLIVLVKMNVERD